ncbi:PREDICTED: uncharacterized protein LOC105570390 [Vollenhovia emeryi]|uniref:uncharacterized protein LOC105570390 n=1 Tax=Vollenhovia emeryi TaxID=411798 RepID=UPI0005F3FC84|nr:PREDICTED: uncharacterized protein LOC105570390 [Vollenhovia emeryi]
MIITRGTVTAAAATTTTTTAARWPLLPKRGTLGRACHNVGGKRTDLRIFAASAMWLARGSGRRVVHEYDNSIEPRWINGSCTAIASALPRVADGDVPRAEGSTAARVPGSDAAVSGDVRFPVRRDGLPRCCA